MRDIKESFSTNPDAERNFVKGFNSEIFKELPRFI